MLLVSIIILISLVLIHSFTTFNKIPKIVKLSNTNFRPNSLATLYMTDDEVWKIEEDSSEVECESSSEIARRKEKERLAAEKAKAEAEAKAKAEAEMKAKAEAEAMKTNKSQEKKVAAVVESKAVTATPSDSTSLTEGKAGAFDFGLLLAFPVIIGTLALFFVFPLIKDQLAANLPPPNTP